MDGGFGELRQRTPEPFYQDFASDLFTSQTVGGLTVTNIVGSSPVPSDTEGLSVFRVSAPIGANGTLDTSPDCIAIAFVIDGEVTINGATVPAASVARVAGADATTITAHSDADLLLVSVPRHPTYEPRRIDLRQMGGPGMPGRPEWVPVTHGS